MGNITSATKIKTSEEGASLVAIFLPRADDDGTGKVEQTETVTINGTKHIVPRGEYTQVTPEVFMQLRNKYPGL